MKKWFYPLQAKAKAWLGKNCTDITLNSQEVTKNVVYENYSVTDEEGKRQCYIVAMYKNGNNIGINKTIALFSGSDDEN